MHLHVPHETVVLTIASTDVNVALHRAWCARTPHTVPLALLPRAPVPLALQELWDKLRVCCGAQMSRSFRASLQHTGNHTWKSGHGGGQFQYGGRRRSPAEYCRTYDLDDIEQKLMASRVFKTCGENIKYTQRMSQMDAVVDGSYCSRSVKATAERKTCRTQ